MKIFDEYNNIVIKIGSSIIVDQVKTSINTKWLYSLCSDVKFLSNKGKNITIITSGAIALGKKSMLNRKKLFRLEDKQAAAAIGQIELINNWQKNFLKHNVKCAQLLLTLSDSEERKRYLNAQRTINSLLKIILYQ